MPSPLDQETSGCGTMPKTHNVAVDPTETALMTPRFFVRRRAGRVALFAGLAAAMLLSGCAHWRPSTQPTRSPESVQNRVVQLMPSKVSDKQGWADDIQAAFSAQHLNASDRNLCATLAVAGQESSFHADPRVPGLDRIARRELERRAAAAHVPPFLLDGALDLKSSTGQTYKQRLSHVHTERQLSELFEDFVGQVPLGRKLLGGFNPVHTGGPMQVDVRFATAHDANYPYPVDGSIRHEVFSRRGGLYFGILHLLGYPTDYPSPLYRFADYNAGWYASRNAAFQRAVSRITGDKLALDGDLVIYGSSATSHTERATLQLADRLGLSDDDIHAALKEGESPDFANTAVYRRVFALADKQAGKRVPRAILPGIKLDSPKITRDLTTAWFAKRVESRWKQCMARAGS
ncbi:MAG: DUF1615 domain-containing protein [Salinisphaera sp.]